MYYRFPITIGLILFIAIITLPLWTGLFVSETLRDPIVKPVSGECVESVEYMRKNHMKLLYKWRDLVVRESINNYTNEAGKIFEISLTNTCLECHSDSSEFCARCHEKVGAEITCWGCHFETNDNR